ncbi:hypothetical protein ARMSODRAFT_975333 [Armillaria solidipes]|uniref:Uncharacterized protein n=1 Tax=Armillaria solidipes TaxID=1076256 RepID=A0A2H3BWT8_9AGAR|nr:hypothetical protein ARMSODRAFT_975333 [Armillaria solidipes]
MTLDYYSRNRHSLNDDRGYSYMQTGIRSVTRSCQSLEVVFPTAVLSSESRIRYERGIDSLLASLHPSRVGSRLGFGEENFHGRTCSCFEHSNVGRVKFGYHFYTEATQAGFVKESNTSIEAFFSTSDQPAFRHSRLSTSSSSDMFSRTCRPSIDEQEDIRSVTPGATARKTSTDCLNIALVPLLTMVIHSKSRFTSYGGKCYENADLAEVIK